MRREQIGRRFFIGHMAKLVDALVSGTSGATLGSSSLLMPTILRSLGFGWLTPGKFWGCSSVGRALRSQCRGREFESHQLHQKLNKAGGLGLVAEW